jgi:hypothetical protein
MIPGGDKSVLSAVAAYSENSGVLKTTEFWSKPLHTATTQSKHSSAVHLISNYFIVIATDERHATCKTQAQEFTTEQKKNSLHLGTL